MIGISKEDFTKYGCPCCGYYPKNEKLSSFDHTTVRCDECGNYYVVFADGVTRAVIGHATNKKERGITVFEFPYVQPHPRRGTHRHLEVNNAPSINQKIRNYVYSKKY